MIILLTAPGIKLMGGDQIGQKTESRYELVEEVFGKGDLLVAVAKKREKRNSREVVEKREKRGTERGN